MWLASAALRKTAEAISGVVGQTTAAVESAYRRGRSHYKEPLIVVHEVPDSRMEEMREIERRYQRNVQLIHTSRLPQEAKDGLLDLETNKYEASLAALLGS